MDHGQRFGGALPASCRNHCAAMWPCLATGSALAAWLAAANPQALLFAGPALGAWLAGPLAAWWISRPRPAEPVRLAEPQIRQFRRWARQTWHYFEEMVGEEDHWLPPDNLQEHPHWMVAHRTSPTNIGMGLLADLAAHDLGYVSTAALLARTGRTLHTLANWSGIADISSTGTIRTRFNRPNPATSPALTAAISRAPSTALQTGLKELRIGLWSPHVFSKG